jgi:tetrahydromethanopterin S-methyltransferase subunit B
MTAEQETKEDMQNGEEIYQENPQLEQNVEQRDYADAEEPTEQKTEQTKNKSLRINIQGEDRGNFVHGLAVGLGIGCIATFVIVWISLFFTPRLPNAVTYESLLSIFIYPLIYLLAVGLIALTAGIVREYYSARSKF